jgi:membrane dipeptidase
MLMKFTEKQEKRVTRLHREAVIIDTHCDTLMQLITPVWGQPPSRDFNERSEKSHIDFPKMVEGGITCQTFGVYTGTKAVVPEACQNALKMIAKFHEIVETNTSFSVVQKAEDIVAAKKEGRVCGLLSLEGAEPLMGELDFIKIFYKLGVRMMSLCWNWRTPFADGLYAAESGSSLPELGLDAVELMGELGIVFDVSHLADSVFWSVNDVINGPYIASHSNSRKVCDHPRNLTDEMIVALAEHGGVMGLNYEPTFVHKDKATVETLVDHVDHIVELVGPEHVGLGSDYDGIVNTPIGLEDITKLPNFTRELVKRDYSDQEIKAILGGNFLRVFQNIL